MKLYGSIPALVTPFTPSGDVDLTALDQLISWQCDVGSDALVIGGSTGEGSSLKEKEREEIISQAIKSSQEKLPIIVGVASAYTGGAIDQLEMAKSIGADAALVLFPYNTKPNFSGCLAHFEKISERGFPFIVYHHPGRTGIRMSAKELSMISSLDHVIGLKDASGDLNLVSSFKQLSKTPLFAGDDVLALPYLSIGAQGSISIVANLFPRFWKEFIDQFLNGNFSSAKECFNAIFPLISCLNEEINPQGIKCALEIVKKISGDLRLPLIKPSSLYKKKLESLIVGFESKNSLYMKTALQN